MAGEKGERLVAHLDGVRIGMLAQTDRGALGFAYDAGYRDRAGATPLSLAMPLAGPPPVQRVGAGLVRRAAARQR